MISCSSIVSVHGVPLSLEEVEVILCCFRVLMGGSLFLDCAINDGHDALLDLTHVMRGIAYHEQEGDHVLLVFPSSPCRLIFELHLDVRWAVLQDQVIRPGFILDTGVPVLLVLLLYDHEQI